jgi:uncharacterized protein YuzE
MEKVIVYYDRTGNTLTIWLDLPTNEHLCEEAGDDTVVMKDQRGRVIGIECLNYLPGKQQPAHGV